MVATTDRGRSWNATARITANGFGAEKKQIYRSMHNPFAYSCEPSRALEFLRGVRIYEPSAGLISSMCQYIDGLMHK